MPLSATSFRYECPVEGGTGRGDWKLGYDGEERWLLVHEQHGGYGREGLTALAEAAEAPSVYELLDDPLRYLAPFLVGEPGHRAAGVPLPSGGSVDAWAAALLASRGPLHYLTEQRGLSVDVIKAGRIGWDRDRGRLVFPMYYGGELVAAKWRKPRCGVQIQSWAGSGRPWPLYPEVDRRKGWALLVAGELDALRGRSVGLPAVSVTTGAGGWHDTWTDELRGVRVVVCFDNNEKRQARERVDGLRSAEIDARRLDLRSLGLDAPKGDLSDYLNGGGDPARLHLKRRVRRSA